MKDQLVRADPEERVKIDPEEATEEEEEAAEAASEVASEVASEAASEVVAEVTREEVDTEVIEETTEKAALAPTIDPLDTMTMIELPDNTTTRDPPELMRVIDQEAEEATEVEETITKVDMLIDHPDNTMTDQPDIMIAKDPQEPTIMIDQEEEVATEVIDREATTSRDPELNTTMRGQEVLLEVETETLRENELLEKSYPKSKYLVARQFAVMYFPSQTSRFFLL
jgi:hypothetical protein